MLGSMLPLSFFPFVVFSHASPISSIHPGHGGAPAPAMPPPLQAPSYYSSALPTPSSVPNHENSPQQPLNRDPAILDVPQQPVAPPSPSPAAGLAIYYGMQSPLPEDPSLAELCADPSISTILLGNVHSFEVTNGFPKVDFGAAGCTTKHAADDRLAPGLAWCPELGRQVQTCQTRGKQVFLSIGGGLRGGDSTIAFVDVADARRAAVMLWSLFGQGDPHAPGMRPLGEAAVDGFDFAWTTTLPSSSASVQAFADTLRTLSDMRKNYKPSHISRTPACATDNADDDDDDDDYDLFRDMVDVTFVTPTDSSAGDDDDDDACLSESMKDSRFCRDAAGPRASGCASPYRRRLAESVA